MAAQHPRRKEIDGISTAVVVPLWVLLFTTATAGDVSAGREPARRTPSRRIIRAAPVAAPLLVFARRHPASCLLLHLHPFAPRNALQVSSTGHIALAGPPSQRRRSLWQCVPSSFSIPRTGATLTVRLAIVISNLPCSQSYPSPVISATSSLFFPLSVLCAQGKTCNTNCRHERRRLW